MGIAAPMAPPEAQGPHPLVQGMTALTDMSKAKYDKLTEAQGMLKKVSGELMPLTKLGDLVSQEDVIKAAGKIVGHGLSAGAVAGLLADMPEKGDALSAWVGQHMQQIQQRQAQLAPVLAQAQHQMGVHAIQLLAAHHIAGAPEAPEAGSPSPGGPAETDANPFGAAPPPTGGSNAG